MAEVIELNDIESLAGFRLAWDALWLQTPRATFFHTYEWLAAYWRHFGQGQKLRVLVVQSGGKPIGIVPLCVRTEQHEIGSVRVLTFPLDDWGNWYGPVGRDATATLLMAMQHIRNSEHDWDMIDLRWLGPSGEGGCRTARAMRFAALEPRREDYREASAIDLDGGWEQYLAGIQTERRQELLCAYRRTFGRNDVEYIRHRPLPAREGDGDPRWDLWELCEQVAGGNWQTSVGRGSTAAHGGNSAGDFLHEAHGEAARLGMLDVNLLLIGGQPMAFVCNYISETALTRQWSGYDPRFEQAGGGVAMMLRMIEDGCARGDSAIDLGSRPRDCESLLRTRVEHSYRLTHTPLFSWRSQAVRLTRWAKGWRQRAAMSY